MSNPLFNGSGTCGADGRYFAWKARLGTVARLAASAAAICALAACAFGTEGEEPDETDQSSSSVSASAYVFNTGGLGVNVRKSASTSATIVGYLPEGANVKITCQTTGTSVSGTSVWNYIADRGGYVADAFLYTGYNGFIPGVSKCGSSGGSAGASGSSGSGTLSGPLYVRGVKLSATREKWVRHIGKEIVKEMRGTREQRISKAAYVAWWSLKEGVLSLDNPLSYSNCTFPPDKRIGALEVCPNPNNAWQVGISGVQAAWRTQASVESLALQVHPEKTLKQILASAAVTAGYPTSTSTYAAIVNSTGRLRISWLLREGAVGFEAQYPTVKGECFDTCQTGSEYTCKWCFGSGWDDTASFAPTRSASLAAIADLRAIFGQLAP